MMGATFEPTPFHRLQAVFELLVNGQRAGDQARGRRADSVSVQRFEITMVLGGEWQM